MVIHKKLVSKVVAFAMVFTMAFGNMPFGVKEVRAAGSATTAVISVNAGKYDVSIDGGAAVGAYGTLQLAVNYIMSQLAPTGSIITLPDTRPETADAVITIPKDITALTVKGGGTALTNVRIYREPTFPAVTLTIDNLNIKASGGSSAIEIASNISVSGGISAMPAWDKTAKQATNLNPVGTAKLYLKGLNTITGGDNTSASIYSGAAVKIIKDTCLTIDSADAPGTTTGTLKAANSYLNNAAQGSAVIGGVNDSPSLANGDAGIIVINGGTLTANPSTSGANNGLGAGIGGAGSGTTGATVQAGSGGTLVVNGGSVTATANYYSTNGAGSTAIGGGYCKSGIGGNGGTVIVTGGSVTALSSASSKGNTAIGGGSAQAASTTNGGSGADLIVLGGTVAASGQGTSSAVGAGIGGGTSKSGVTGAGGYFYIRAGVVTATTVSAGAPGIGSGGASGSAGSGAGPTMVMEGGIVIAKAGATGYPDIGSGLSASTKAGNAGSITIIGGSLMGGGTSGVLASASTPASNGYSNTLADDSSGEVALQKVILPTLKSTPNTPVVSVTVDLGEDKFYTAPIDTVTTTPISDSKTTAYMYLPTSFNGMKPITLTIDGVKYSTTYTYVAGTTGTATINNYKIDVQSVSIKNKASIPAEMSIGETFDLEALVTPAGANQVVTWASDAIDKVTVDATTGLVKAVAAGEANITATTVEVGSDGQPKTDTCKITVGSSIAQPPADVTGLIANLNSNGIDADLSWNASEGANSYEIYRATEQAGDYTKIGSSATTSFSTTASAPASPLVNGNTYYFKVLAFKSGAPSINYSNTASVKIPDLEGVTNLAVDNVTIPTVSMVKLNWTPAVSNLVTGYEICYSLTQGSATNGTVKAVSDKTISTVTITGLSPSKTYYFTIKSVRGTTAKSAALAEISVATAALPVVTGFQATSVTDKSFTFSWNAYTGATKYKIYRFDPVDIEHSESLESIDVASGTTAAYSINGKTDGTNYKKFDFYITAVVSADSTTVETPPSAVIRTSSLSNAIGTTVSPAVMVSNSALDGQVQFSWGKVPSYVGVISDYVVYKNTADITMGPSDIVATIPLNANTPDPVVATITGLTNGTKYYFKFALKNTEGLIGKQTSSFSATPIASRPNAIGTVPIIVTSGDEKVTLSWAAPASLPPGAGSIKTYNIYTSTDNVTYTKVDDANITRAEATANTVIVTGLQNGTKIYFKIAYVVDAVSLPLTNTESAQSPAVFTTPLSAVAAPADFLAVLNGSTADLKWSEVANAIGYNIYNNGTKLNTSPTTLTSYTVQNLSPGENKLQVSAINSNNVEGNHSDEQVIMFVTHVQGLTVDSAKTDNITLSWTTSTDEAVTGYEIYYSTQSSVTTSSDKIVVNGKAISSQKISNLLSGTTYYFAIVAVTTTAKSELSNTISRATSRAGTVANFAVSGIGDRSVSFSWESLANATTYKLYSSTTNTPGSYSLIGTVDANATTYTYTSAQNGTKTFYYITALIAGEETGQSVECYTTTFSDAVSNFVATSGDTTVTLTWNKVDNQEVSGYEIYTSSDGVNFVKLPVQIDQPAGSGIITKSFSDLVNGTTYYYKIAIVNLQDFSGKVSSSISATPDFPTPLAPTAPTATAGNTQAVLSWTPIDGAVSYKVYQKTSEAGEYALVSDNIVINTSTTPVTATITNLSNNVAVWFKLTYIDSHTKESIRSNAVSVTPIPAVSNLKPTAVGDKSITVTWDSYNGAAGYNVYAGTSATGSFTKMTASPITATSYTQNNTAPVTANGTKYYFYVVPIIGDVEAVVAKSNITSTTPLAKVSSPTVTAGDYAVGVTWTKVSGASAYILYYKAGSSSFSSTDDTGVAFVTVGDVNSATIPGLFGNTKYYVGIVPVNSENLKGILSSQGNATTKKDPAPPAPVAVAKGDRTVILTWAPVEGAISYKVYKGTSNQSGATIDTDSNPALVKATMTGVSSGTAVTYNYTYAKASSGESDPSSDSNSVTPYALLSAPSITATLKNGTTAALSWSAVTGAKGYNIYKGTELLTNTTSLAYDVTNLPSGTWSFQVATVNANDEEGAKSTAKSVTVVGLAAPTGLAANNITSSGLTLTWNVASTATGYKIYYSTTTPVNVTTTPIDISGGTTVSKDITGLQKETKYYFVIKSVSATDESAVSNEYSVTTKGDDITLSSASISGIAKVGEILTATPSYTGGTPESPSLAYEWQVADTVGGTYTLITGATMKTYVIAANYAGKFIKVKIIATGTATGNATSTATVAIEKSDAQKATEAVAADKSALQITYASGDSQSSVTKNLTLLTLGSSGSTIAWSSAPNLVSGNGTITRPVTDTPVTLTATITNGAASDTKQFIVTVKAAPTYGIETITAPVFADQLTGYAPVNPVNVTITKTGTGDITGLTVTVTGADATSFTVTQPVANTLNGTTTSTTFTAKPNDGLAAKTYNAVIHVAGSNGVSQDVPVTFKVTAAPTYGIETITAPTFADQLTGYAPISPESVTITKTGTGDITGLAVTVTGADATSFTVTQPVANTLNGITTSTTFTVKPNDGLAAKTYNAVIHVAGSNGVSQDVPVTFKVTAAPTYGIETITAPVFADQLTGYAPITAENVTITKAGTGDITGLAVTVTGADTTSFTVTQPVANTLNGITTSTTFTVKPNDGLAAKIYNAVIHVAGSNGVSQDVPVAFKVTVAPTYGIETITAPVFADQLTGYAPITAESVTITKAGTGDITGLTVTVTGADATSFTVTQPVATTLNGVTTSTTFTVKPNDGLVAKTYNAVIHVAGSNGVSQDVSVVFKVTVAPTYGIETITAPVFADQLTGYAPVTAESVTITKAGTGDITSLAVTVTGVDATSFTVTQPVANTLNGVTTSTTFTAKPNDGLAAKTYNAVIHVAGSNGVSQDVPVTFKVTAAPTYGIETITAPVFADQLTGYAPVTPENVTITKTGTGDITGLTVTVTGADATSFTVTQPVVNTLNGTTTSTTFTVKPNDGLVAKTYNAIIHVAGSNGVSQDVPVTFKVTAAQKSDCDITAFKFVLDRDYTGFINTVNNEIIVYVPGSTDITNLVATFEISDGATIKVGEITQVSGVTANNFMNVAYSVTAKDGTTKRYSVQIIKVSFPKPFVSISPNFINYTTPNPEIRFTEPVTLADGTAITTSNIGSLLTFKNTLSGQDVSFTATLLADGVTYIIVPSEVLDFSTFYRVQVAAVKGIISGGIREQRDSTFMTPEDPSEFHIDVENSKLYLYANDAINLNISDVLHINGNPVTGDINVSVTSNKTTDGIDGIVFNGNIELRGGSGTIPISANMIKTINKGTRLIVSITIDGSIRNRNIVIDVLDSALAPLASVYCGLTLIAGESMFTVREISTFNIKFSSGVKKANGQGEISTDDDIKTIVTFAEATNSANTVAYTAQIDSAKEVITITPTAPLDFNKQYKIMVAPVTGIDSNKDTVQKVVTFGTYPSKEHVDIFVSRNNPIVIGEATTADILAWDFNEYLLNGNYAVKLTSNVDSVVYTSQTTESFTAGSATIHIPGGKFVTEGLQILTAEVSVGDKTITGSTNVKVTAAPTYGIETITAPVFADQLTGYAPINPENVTITKAGTGDITGLAVTVTGADATSFTVTQPVADTLNGTTTSTTFTVKPNDGLAAKIYNAVIHVAGSNGVSQDVPVAFKVTVAPTYGIETITAPVFADQLTGYAPITPESVTITKTGTGDITGLTVTVTGADATSFTVTQPVANTLNGTTTSSTFTVKPNDGLAAKTYNAVIHVAGSNGVSQDVSVTFKVTAAPTYGIETITAPVFADQLTGYAPITPESVTITKAGTGDITGLAVTVTGADATSFTVTQPVATTLNGTTTSTTFTIKPNDGLVAKTYNAVIHVAGSNGVSQDVSVTFKVTVAPTYGIETITAPTFADKLTGYAPITAENVTITKAGTGDITGLTVTVTGADATSFTVTQPVANTLNGTTTSTTFTTKPNDGLAAKTYNAVIHVAGSNGVSQDVPVTFKVTAAPTYGIETIAAPTFADQLTGYAPVTPESVTITKTGTGDITGLAVTVTGADATSFTVTQPVATTLNGTTTSTTFTVKPNDGLVAKIYNAVVHVAGSNGVSQDVPVTFKVTAVPTYGIETITAPVFADQLTGYAPVTAESVTITKAGTGDITGLAVTVTGADATSFTVTQPVANTLNGTTTSTTFTVKPNDGLAAKTYNAIIHLAGSNGVSQDVPVTFKVTAVTPVTIPVTGVRLNQSTAALTVGESITLIATVLPEDATYQNVSWSSSDTVIASVYSTGTVTANAAGTATITVKTADGGFKAECLITVNPAPVTKYVVTFNPNSGTAVASQEVVAGEKATVPTEPTRSGYIFVGWYADANLTNAFDFANTKINTAIMIYAKWTQITYIVTFNTNGGGTVASQIVLSGEKATIPTDPTWSGYTFGGWYADANLTKAFDFVATAINAPTTVYAKWAIVSTGGGGGSGDRGGSSGVVTPPTTPVPTPTTTPATPEVTVPSTVNTGKKPEIAVAVATTNEKVTEGSNVIINTTPNIAEINKALDNGATKVVLSVGQMDTANVVSANLTAQTIEKLGHAGTTLEVNTPIGVYQINCSSINLATVVDNIGKDIPLENISVKIEVGASSTQMQQVVNTSISNNNLKMLSQPIDFKISFSNNNKQVNLTNFTSFVQRLIPIPQGTDASKVTTVVVIEQDGTVRQVPTKIITTNGISYANVSSVTNSTYVLINNTKTFSDMNNHWAKNNAQELGSRLIIKGTETGAFAPDKAATRAEFVSMVSRAVGLKASDTKQVFKDVSSDKWYYGDVNAAYQYGLITGDEKGNFNANKTISRQESMLIVSRLLKLTDIDTSISDDDIAQAVSKFKDGNKVSNWAKQGIAICVKFELANGDNNGNISATQNITRAQIATLIYNTLKNINLI